MNNFINEFKNADWSKYFIIFPKLLFAVIIFVIFYFIALFVKKIIFKIGKNVADDNRKILRLLGNILKIVIIFIGITTALGTLGLNVSALVAGLGLTGFAFGFALKDALSNLLAGILILFYHPFKTGDKIKVAGCEGIVTEINLRYTKLEDENSYFLIPNSTCFNNWVIINKENPDKNN